MPMAFVGKVFMVDFDNLARHPARFRIPADVIAYGKFRHSASMCCHVV
jgi:hypothetical protein